MKNENQNYLYEIKKTIHLEHFKQFCYLFSSATDKQKLRNIFYFSSCKVKTTINMFQNEMKIVLTEDEAKYMLELIQAYLNKSTFRKKVDNFVRNELLVKQNHKCAICSCYMDNNAHLDHIIPFKYVGDELKNNYQLLCPNCNRIKNVNMDYQLKYLIRKL